MKPSQKSPAERAAAIAHHAREHQAAQRKAVAARTEAEAPELYALAKRLKQTFGAGTRIRFVRFADGSTWGTPSTDEGVMVIASSSKHAGGAA